jgi:hypothetical protein
MEYTIKRVTNCSNGLLYEYKGFHIWRNPYKPANRQVWQAYKDTHVIAENESFWLLLAEMDELY